MLPIVRLEGAEYRTSKIVCVGRNFAAHVEEMKSELPTEPILFLKPPTAAVFPNGGEIHVPAELGELHHEVELAALLGERGKNVTEDEASTMVAGYAVAMDLTLRKLQNELKRTRGPWAMAKGFDNSAPLGEFVSAAKLPDITDIALELQVNGETRQQGRTSQMIFSPAKLIAHASRYVTLERGDIFLTGTPSGVGPLVDGDKIHASIDGLPVLSFAVRR